MIHKVISCKDYECRTSIRFTFWHNWISLKLGRKQQTPCGWVGGGSSLVSRIRWLSFIYSFLRSCSKQNILLSRFICVNIALLFVFQSSEPNLWRCLHPGRRSIRIRMLSPLNLRNQLLRFQTFFLNKVANLGTILICGLNISFCY